MCVCVLLPLLSDTETQTSRCSETKLDSLYANANIWFDPPMFSLLIIFKFKIISLTNNHFIVKPVTRSAEGYLWSKLYQILNNQALSCLVLLRSEPSAMLICPHTHKRKKSLFLRCFLLVSVSECFPGVPLTELSWSESTPTLWRRQRGAGVSSSCNQW